MPEQVQMIDGAIIHIHNSAEGAKGDSKKGFDRSKGAEVPDYKGFGELINNDSPFTNNINLPWPFQVPETRTCKSPALGGASLLSGLTRPGGFR